MLSILLLCDEKKIRIFLNLHNCRVVTDRPLSHLVIWTSGHPDMAFFVSESLDAALVGLESRDSKIDWNLYPRKCRSRLFSRYQDSHHLQNLLLLLSRKLPPAGSRQHSPHAIQQLVNVFLGGRLF